MLASRRSQQFLLSDRPYWQGGKGEGKGGENGLLNRANVPMFLSWEMLEVFTLLQREAYKLTWHLYKDENTLLFTSPKSLSDNHPSRQPFSHVTGRSPLIEEAWPNCK